MLYLYAPHFPIRACLHMEYLEHFQQSLLLDLQPLKRLLLLDDFLAQVLQTREVVARHAPVPNIT